MSDISDLVISTEGIELAPGIEFEIKQKGKRVVTDAYILPIAQTENGLVGFFLNDDESYRPIRFEFNGEFYRPILNKNIKILSSSKPNSSTRIIPITLTDYQSEMVKIHNRRTVPNGQVVTLYGINDKPLFLVREEIDQLHFVKIDDSGNGTLQAHVEIGLVTGTTNVKQYLKKFNIDSVYD